MGFDVFLFGLVCVHRMGISLYWWGKQVVCARFCLRGTALSGDVVGEVGE